MLEEAEYQHILGVVESMAHVLEWSPKAFHHLDEESLRTHFLVHLNGHYEETYGDVSGHNCGWCTGGAGPVWGRPLGVEVRQVLRLVSLVIARSATGDLVTVQGRLC
jgi:hypothetical protein